MFSYAVCQQVNPSYSNNFYASYIQSGNIIGYVPDSYYTYVRNDLYTAINYANGTDIVFHDDGVFCNELVGFDNGYIQQPSQPFPMTSIDGYNTILNDNGTIPISTSQFVITIILLNYKFHGQIIGQPRTVQIISGGR